ncbi:MAG: hypothetical protein V7709_13890 [Halioglobus sp.]
MSNAISSGLKININHLTVLIDSQPEIMLFAVDLNGPAHRRTLHRGRTYLHILGDFVSGAQYR